MIRIRIHTYRRTYNIGIHGHGTFAVSVERRPDFAINGSLLKARSICINIDGDKVMFFVDLNGSVNKVIALEVCETTILCHVVA